MAKYQVVKDITKNGVSFKKGAIIDGQRPKTKPNVKVLNGIYYTHLPTGKKIFLGIPSEVMSIITPGGVNTEKPINPIENIQTTDKPIENITDTNPTKTKIPKWALVLIGIGVGAFGYTVVKKLIK